MVKLIINADDFALTDGVCSAIARGIALGAITDTTVMVCVTDAHRRVADYLDEVGQRMGIHLQLTTGDGSCTPVTLSRFVPYGELARMTAAEAEEEWEAQIERARSWGLQPNHLDTHHDVHRLPHLAPVFLRVAKRHSLPVRGGPDLAGQMRAVGVQGTVCQVGQWSESGAQAALVDELKGALSNDVSVVEVVAHPGYFDDDLLQATPEPWARCRPVNLETLIALCSEGLYSSLGLQLASFSDAFI